MYETRYTELLEQIQMQNEEEKMQGIKKQENEVFRQPSTILNKRKSMVKEKIL